MANLRSLHVYFRIRNNFRIGMIYKKYGLANDNDMNVASGATALGVYWFFSDGFFCVVLERSISQINRANSDMD